MEIVLTHAAGMSLRYVAEEYHRRHPDQTAPHHATIGRLLERFKGAVTSSCSSCKSTLLYTCARCKSRTLKDTIRKEWRGGEGGLGRNGSFFSLN